MTRHGYWMLSNKLTWSTCGNSNFVNSLSKGDQKEDHDNSTTSADGRAQVPKWSIITHQETIVLPTQVLVRLN